MINESIHTYLQQLVSPKPAWIKTMEEQAKKDNVPIMESVAIDFMLNQIKIHQPRQILEVGTAIGYSALRMLEASPEAEIITIEKDEQRFEEASKTINKQNKNNQINVRLGDALDVMQELQAADKSFDFIFIDAAKGKYRAFFESAHQLLNKGGWLVTDNVLFRGYVANPESAPKRYKTMIRKISEYNQFLCTHPEYITSILPIGDGVMLSHKIDWKAGVSQ